MAATFYVSQGTDKEYLLTAKDSGAAIDLTGAKIYATVKTAANAASAGTSAFRRRNTAAGGGDTEVEVLTQSGATLGQFKLKFIPGNTSALTPGFGYVIDVFLITAGSKRYQIVEADVFEVRTAVTTDFT